MKNIFISPTFQRSLVQHCFSLRVNEVSVFIQAIAEFANRVEYGKPLQSKNYVQQPLAENTGFIAVRGTLGITGLMLTYAIIGNDILFCAVLQPLVCNLRSFELEIQKYMSRSLKATMRQALQHYRRGNVQSVTLNSVFGIIRSYVKE